MTVWDILRELVTPALVILAVGKMYAMGQKVDDLKENFNEFKKDCRQWQCGTKVESK